MRSIELFAGAGGLALGVAFAGFKHEAVIERDKPTYTTLCTNQQRGVQPINSWPVLNHDVRQINYAEFAQNIELLAGGPPCQPFLLAGKHAGYNDQRDMFPEAIRAVRELKPQVFIFENVKGLLRQAFADYFGYIQLQLSYPEIVIKYNEAWLEHYQRINQHQQANGCTGLHYRIQHQLVNDADYGVAQRRERVFIVGIRSDLALN